MTRKGGGLFWSWFDFRPSDGISGGTDDGWNRELSSSVTLRIRYKTKDYGGPDEVLEEELSKRTGAGV